MTYTHFIRSVGWGGGRAMRDANDLMTADIPGLEPLPAKPHSWRLVSEADDRVVEMCHGLHGWQHMYRRPGEDAC